MVNWHKLSNSLSSQILEVNGLESLLDRLGCTLHPEKGGCLYRGRCPVHGGDGANFQLAVGGYSLPIYWRCFSRDCHEEFKPSLLGLVRGILSYKQNGTKVPLTEAVDYLNAFLAGRVQASSTTRRPTLTPPPTPSLPAWTREQVRGRLQIPSPYFLSRGFSATVLDALDVGHSPKLRRSVVPLYDESGEVCVGIYSRSEKPKCPKCNGLHDPWCDCQFAQAKWRAPKDFPKKHYLYNYCNARKAYLPVVLLVEGPGDVFRAMEADSPAVALLGTDLSDWQAERLAALDKAIIVALDNDEAGRRASDSVYERLSRHASEVVVLPPPPDFKDVGDMPAETVRKWLGPCLSYIVPD